jgi:hypothetical protein
MARIHDETVSKFELKLSYITFHASVSMKGTTISPCAFTLIITTELDRHLGDANSARKSDYVWGRCVG